MKFEKTKPQEFIDMGYTKEDEIATKDLEMHFIEIPKFVKKNPEANTKLEQWLWLIVGREEKLKMAKKENKERISSENLLMAIIADSSALAMKVLEQLGVDAVEIKYGILKEIDR